MLKSAYRAGERAAQNLEARAHLAKTWLGEVGMIHKRRAEHRAIELTPEQLKSLDALWGARSPRRKWLEKWIRLYTKRTGTFAADFMPEIVYSTRIEPQLVDQRRGEVLADKALTEILFAGVEGLAIPKTILVRSNGFYYDSNRQPITESKARTVLEDAGRVFMKPSIGEAGGRGVAALHLSGGQDRVGGSTIDGLLQGAPKDFIVQEAISQHEAYATLHPESVNTVRVVTYFLDGEVHTWPTIMRMGAHGGSVDNAHADGLFIGVENDGSLLDWATNMDGERFKKHPSTGVKFSGYVVPGIAEMEAVAARSHGRMPGMGLVSWDFALGEDGVPILVETNLRVASIWLPQLAHAKGAFRENTRRVLELAGIADSRRLQLKFGGDESGA